MSYPSIENRKIIEDYFNETNNTIMYPKTDFEIEKIFDEYFDKVRCKNTMKLHREDDVIKMIKDLVNSPKGIVPDSVYELIPNIKF